jgi:hypothetical protein
MQGSTDAVLFLRGLLNHNKVHNVNEIMDGGSASDVLAPTMLSNLKRIVYLIKV